MIGTEPSGLTGQLLFLGTAITILLSGAMLFAAGLSPSGAVLSATATVLALLVVPGRLLFWVLGAALFFVIALLPNAMGMWWYAAESTVIEAVLGSTAVILLLVWFATVFGPLKTRR